MYDLPNVPKFREAWLLAAVVRRLVAVPTSNDALLSGPAGQVGICTRQQLGVQHANHGCQSLEAKLFGSVC